MNCNSCGKALKPNLRFCNGCGARIAVASAVQHEPATPPVELENACTHCGKVLKPNARFCNGCGTTVAVAPVTQSTPVTFPPVKTDKKVCASCGNTLKPNMRFCNSCGASIVVAHIAQPLPEMESTAQIQPTGVKHTSFLAQRNGYASTNEYPAINPDCQNMSQIKNISTVLPILGPVLAYITSLIAHKKTENGLAEMETTVFGAPQGKERTTIGIAFFAAGYSGMLIPYILALLFKIAGMSSEDAVIGVFILIYVISVAGIIGLLFWIWKSSSNQRDRLLRLAYQLDVTVEDKRGLGFVAFGCFGSWIMIILIIIFTFALVIAWVPAVRQYRTVKMYNEVVWALNLRRNV